MATKKRPKPQHGRGRYVHHKCRCKVCTQANREYQLAYWHRLKAVDENKEVES